VNLRNEIANLAVNMTKPVTSVLISNLIDVPSSECSAHEQLLGQGFLNLSGISSPNGSACQDLASHLQASFSVGYEKICRYAWQAERFAEDHPAAQLNDATLQTLEGEIATAAEALFHAQAPENLMTSSEALSLRQILTKIRTPEMLTSIANQIVSIQNSIGSAKQNANCLTSSDLSNLNKYLQSILTELQGAQTYLNQLNQAGLVQAAQDKQKVLSAGRTRDDLPIPSMTDEERVRLSYWMGAVFWRMRGGGLIKASGTNVARTYFVLYPTRVLGQLNGGSVGESVASDFELRLQLKGWSDWMDMGHSAGDDKYHDLVFLSDRGHYQIQGAMQTFADNGYDTTELEVAGYEMGPIYYFTWAKLNNVTSFGHELTTPYQSFIYAPREWGEFLWGGALYSGMSRSLLRGHEDTP
jgi:hypothetical protein